MRIHILGACGTFMGGLALLARRAGHTVTGQDRHTYPPMSTQLAEEGIELTEGYDAGHLDPKTDLVLIGNALSRGNPAVEEVLNSGIPYTSGPRWLGENYLRNKTVVAVAGNGSHEVVKLGLDGLDVFIDIGMVEFEVVQYGNPGPVMDEFRALVKESGVVFVGFDHKNGLAVAR